MVLWDQDRQGARGVAAGRAPGGCGLGPRQPQVTPPPRSGALLKPWLFTEIKEQRHWDISSSERLDILRDFTSYGLEHWGSDTQGVEKTRRFLLEWLSFLCRWVAPGGGRPGLEAPLDLRPCRYVPVGLLERLPQRVNERPPCYLGRDYLETLMASQQAADWIRIRCPGGGAGAGCRGGPAPGLIPALPTARCSWDLCRPASSSCPSTRPMRTSSGPQAPAPAWTRQ